MCQPHGRAGVTGIWTAIGWRTFGDFVCGTRIVTRVRSGQTIEPLRLARFPEEANSLEPLQVSFASSMKVGGTY